MNAIIQKIGDTIDQATHIGIVSHENPDGDNLGSCSALIESLSLLNKSVFFLENDSVPDDLSFLSHMEERVPLEKVSAPLDLLIVLDCSDLHRFGPLYSWAEEYQGTVVNIDHHESNTEFGDINYVIRNATSTGEVLYRVMTELNLPINEKVATSLYTAISSDTGSFQYDSVTGDTHRVIAELVDHGADTNLVNISLYQSRSKEKTALLVQVLQSLEYFEKGKVATAICTLEDVEKTNGKRHDTEGIVEFLRNIEGVEVAIFIKEREEKNKISLRSKSFVDCTQIASIYNGGGHIRASGATSYDDLATTKKNLIERSIQVYRDERPTSHQ